MRIRAAIAALTLGSALLATQPTDATRRWWSYVTALANDGMEGRNTGSEGYKRATRYVAKEFERAGLKPAGENGGYFQAVPIDAIQLDAAASAIMLAGKSGTRNLRWLHDVTIAAQAGLPEKLSAGLIFMGTGAPPQDLALAGKILVRLGVPVGTPLANRPATPLPDGMIGSLTIDNLDGPERRRWPAAYAVNMTLAGAVPPVNPRPAFALNPAAAEELFKGSGHTYADLKHVSGTNQPLPWFEIPSTLNAHLKFGVSRISSDNILAVLPGSDAALSGEYVVVSAHLDGYGFGEPIKGDGLYNGAFDDAAYVATLLDLAQQWKESGVKPRRSILFAIVTGEEKGLLGSRYYVTHPTVPKQQIVADINLDQLRPLFALNLLTMLALDDSTLGDTARGIAETMGIHIQPDPEPDRNLLYRSDHFSFLQIGVPATGFIFGYQPGSAEEAAYRRWYTDRYHSPTDDLKQPWDPQAAAKFNEFFRRVVEAVANANERPRWKPGSKLAPAP